MGNKQIKNKSYESNHELQKLKLFVVIVSDGQAENICEALSKLSCAISITSNGVGTANADAYDVLGFGEKKKQIIFAVVKENKVNDIVEYLHNRFSVSKFSKGVAFSIKISSVVGVSIYKFLTDTKIRNEVKKHEKK